MMPSTIEKEAIEKRRFASFMDHGGNTFRDLVLRRCVFDGCSLSGTKDVGLRDHIFNVKVQDSEANNCSIGCTALHDCEVSNLKANKMVRAFGAVFKHVVLRGRIGGLFVSPFVDPMRPNSDMQRLAERANRAFYDQVDWALDIRDADFGDVDLRGVPGDLVRRNPETQFILRRTTLMAGAWREPGLVGDGFALVIQSFLDGGADAEVVVATKSSHKLMYPPLARLRDAGLAE